MQKRLARKKMKKMF